MMISTTLLHPGQRLAFHRGRVIAFEEDDDMDKKLDEAKKQIDAEVEQEIRDVIQKVLIEKYLI